jgi:hypothetical protein
MRAFYRLHVLTRRKLGVPVQRWRFFQRLHERIMERGLGFVGLVRQAEAVVAAAVFLGYKKTLIYKYGASQPDALACRPNEWLFASVLREAAQEEYDRLDFGVSSVRDTGLRRFKRKWNSEEMDVYHAHLWGPVPQCGGTSRLRPLATTVIQRSPTVVCRSLGALLYRYSQ